MTEAYKKAFLMQNELLQYFHYVSDDRKFSTPEVFDHEAVMLMNSEIFSGDCDTAARTMTEKAKRQKFVDEADLIELVTPNHYIAGVIDREIDDVWIIENTAWKFTKKAAEFGVDGFMDIVKMATFEKFANGFIEPAVYKLSDLQKGIQEEDVATKEFIIKGRFKKYFMESFHTLDTPIVDWYQSRGDLPFLVDFVEKRDISVAPAEYAREYKFTKDWDDSLEYEVIPVLEWVNPPEKKKIALLIGHRKSSQGARSVKKISEYAFFYTWLHTILPFLPDHLEYKIFEREDEDGRGYRKRMSAIGERAEKWGADLIISNHFNSSKNSQAEGYEVLVSRNGQSQEYGRMMIYAMEDNLYGDNRGLRPVADDPSIRGSGFLYKTPMPSILVEWFFGSSFEDWEAVKDGKMFDTLVDFLNRIN